MLQGKIQEKVEHLRRISSNDNNLFFILGPCVIESRDHVLKMAESLSSLADKLGFEFVFKASFDKANRTSIKSFRGPGLEDGIKVLREVREEFSIPIITDIHESWQADAVAEVADVIQIPAYLCRQTDLLLAAGKTGKIINIKKGQFIAPHSMEQVVDKIKSTGNEKIWICERGYTFGYNNLIVDYRNFAIMKSFGVPVVLDATHSVQRPGGLGNLSGGDREFVSFLAASAVVQRIAAVFMEVHDEPEKAKSDGANSVRLSQLESLVSYLLELDDWAKNHDIPRLS